MRFFGRAVRLTLLIVFVLPVAAKALVWSLEDRPRNWWEARWTSAGILPAPADDPEPRIYVFAARTGGWRSIFAVHTWIVVKPAQAEAYTRYDVTGFGRRPIRVNGYVPDSYWIGNRPEMIAAVGGAPRGRRHSEDRACGRGATPYAGEGDYRMWPGPNSNTFVATMLRAAPELEVAMPPEAIGKDFRADGTVFGLTESGTGIEMNVFGLARPQDRPDRGNRGECPDPRRRPRCAPACAQGPRVRPDRLRSPAIAAGGCKRAAAGDYTSALSFAMAPPLDITVITPTTGKPSLDRLIASMDRQTAGSVFHLLLWDQMRDAAAKPPETYNSARRLSVVLPPGLGRNGNAPGSALRAVGLMTAMTPWVTFADDDVRWDGGHLAALADAAQGLRWASTLRTIWTAAGDRLGVDRFESVGDDPGRRVPYEMCDNNCVVFRRELGTAGAVLFRETRDYNDDRLMYRFLKTSGGKRGTTGTPTIHHICPDKLIEFFRTNCSAT